MKHEVVVSPSVLSMDYGRMQEQIQELNESGAKWLHFDVIDGHFAPNLTFGPDILKGIRKTSPLFLDVHLMVSDPLMFVEPFVKAGADLITFHTEALDNDPKKIRQVLDAIHAQNIQGGIVVKPATPIEPFEELLPLCDLVLVMSVVPGFSGQSFMPDQLEKVRWLDQKRQELGLDYRIEIDGGMNADSALLAREAGADTIVAGSYAFKGPIAQAVRSLLGEDQQS